MSEYCSSYSESEGSLMATLIAISGEARSGAVMAEKTLDRELRQQSEAMC